ncbi:hypothetical protein M426DRAFT_60646 [Hypoxylon sp. CI-4A]|nr:hypothetical protein M426DRAFT_60646 [Hypoxylon sp. CI-4A]
MFAVPGWSVSADGLKSEAKPAAPKPTQDESDSRKRKRPSGPQTRVTESNVADLWEQVIEGRSGKKAKSDKDHGSKPGVRERPKVTKKENDSKPTLKSPGDAKAGEEAKKDKKKKKSKALKENEDSEKLEAKEAAANQHKQVSAPKTAPKLTPLQAAMREKLVSARFRHLNETLYTKPSADSFQLFQDSPEMFQEYHEGFRRQVEVWPENPVEGYMRDIKQRGSQKAPQKSRQGGSHSSGPSSSSSGGVAALPRTNNVCTIADLGCGDAKLAESLQTEKKKLRLRLLSYDLQSPSPLVTKADIANLPLEDGSVNVVVFCLALMGTNWLDFVEEAYRILHWKGELWVAEIKSRFGQVGKGGKKQQTGTPVAHSVGNRRKVQGKKGKGKDADGPDGKEDETELAIEVDGADDKREETDVTAFVEALRRRGFVLQGAVDLRNKMFVKMHFIKAASPSVGKGVVALKEPPVRSSTGPKKTGVKFIDGEADQEKVDESSILKPCVYKLR